MIHLNPSLFFLLNGLPDERVFALDAQTFIQAIAHIVNALVIFGLLAFLLYLPVRLMLQKRSEKIRDEMAKSQSDMAIAQQLRTQYEQKLKGVELERSAILDEARKAANERRIQLLAEANTEIETIKARASFEIAAERELAKDQIYYAIVDIASDMAAKVLSDTIDKAAHERLFNEAMVELEATVFKPLDLRRAV